MAASLTSLLFPKNALAFIGGAECAIAIARTKALGFPGKIWAVHPSRDQLGGVPAIRSVADIEGPVDAAFIAVKREAAIDVVAALRRQATAGAVIYASGFAETGDRHLQDQLLAAADGMPLLGPNCYGYVNGIARAALWPDEHGIPPCDTGVAIITQSGNIACNFTMTQRALPLAAVFAIGNQADVDMARMVGALIGDPRITAIGLHIEGVPDAPGFALAAEQARTARKPLVVLKTGRSAQGAKVAMSHTSSLAGSDSLYDALFERYGIARSATLTAFVETLKLLHHGGPLSGNRLVSMSCSGGEAALISDLAAERGLVFPPFPAERKPLIAATLNDYVSIDNPLDYHTFIWNQEEKLTATFSAVLGSSYDAGLLILDTPVNPALNSTSWRKTAKAYATAAKAMAARATIVSSLPEGMPEDLADQLSAQGVTPLIGFDDALSALEAAALIGANWQRREELPPLGQPLPDEAPLFTLLEAEGKALLKSHGLQIPDGQVCTISEAAQAARLIGFPVVMKTAAAIAHKTEAQGVILNINNEKEAEEAAVRLSRLGPEVLVERMVGGAIAELIIGVTRDPQFGLSLVIGAGGVLTELLRDSVTLLLPTRRSEVERAVKRLKVWRLIEGFRGRQGDGEAAVDAILAIATFAMHEAARLEELDVNPLLVLERGAVAVDILIRTRKNIT